MAYSIPRSFIAALVEMALQVDLDLNEILIESGISPMDLRDKEIQTNTDQAIRIYQSAQRVTGDDLIRAGAAPVPVGSLRLLCYAISSVTTAREAANRISEFLKAIPGIPNLRIEVQGERTLVRGPQLPDPGPGHIKTVITAAVLDRVTSWAIGRPAPLIEIELPFARPDNAEDIELVLGDRVRYNAEATELTMVVPTSLLDARIEWDESSILDYLDSAPARLLMPFRAEALLAVRVRRIIEKDLEHDRQTSAEELAAALLISPQTLRRKLRCEGTSVREIRDQVLAAHAAEALRKNREPVELIARRLGFSETSAFTRAFRRWTGSSPTAFRAAGGPSEQQADGRPALG